MKPSTREFKVTEQDGDIVIDVSVDEPRYDSDETDSCRLHVKGKAWIVKAALQCVLAIMTNNDK